MELKKIGVLSTGKIFALFGLVLGLVSIVLTKLICVLGPAMAPQIGLSCADLGLGAFALGTLFYGESYFVGGLILAGLYNLFSAWIGGVQLDFSKK